MRFGRLGVVVLGTALVLAAGCGEILGLDPLKDRTDAADADLADSSDAGADTNDPCALAVVPPRPAQDDPSDASLTLVNVVRAFDLGQRVDGGTAPLFGYDLDGVNTCCDNGPESCVPPVTTGLHCDEEGGRDNSGGELLQVISQFGVSTLQQGSINDTVDAGLGSVVVVIKGYNGKPNDTQVTLAAFSSTGLLQDADGGRPDTKWDGTDVWAIDKGSVLGVDDAGLPIPIQFDVDAYVANGVVVTTIDFPLVFGSGVRSVSLNGATLTGRLVPQGGTFRIDDGQGSGRMLVSTLFSALHFLPNPFGPGFMCPGTLAYDNAKPLICQRADIANDKSLDNTGATCDALSFAVGFTMFPAQVGPVDQDDGGLPPSPCADAGLETCP